MNVMRSCFFAIAALLLSVTCAAAQLPPLTGDKPANADSQFLERAKYRIPLSRRLVCCGLNAKASVSFALITISFLNAFGGASLTLKTLKQSQQFYLKSMPTGLVFAVT